MIQDEQNPAPEESNVAEPLPFPNVSPDQLAITLEVAYGSPWISCRFDPTGRYVFGGCQDNSIQRVNLETSELLAFRSHDSWVRALAFTDDGSQLLSAGYDGRLIWWDVEAAEPEPLRRLDAHQGWVRSMTKSPDGSQVATVGDDHKVKIWDIASGDLMAEFVGHEKNVYSVLFHPDGQQIFSGDLAGVIKQWNVEDQSLVRDFDGAQLHTYNSGQRVDFGGVRSLAVSPDQSLIACSGLHNASNPLGSVHEPLIQVFNLESGELVKSCVTEGIKGGVWRCLFHPNGFLMGATSGTSGGYVLFWNLEEEKDFHQLRYPHVCKDMDLHPDQVRIATPHFDNKIRISQMTAES